MGIFRVQSKLFAGTLGLINTASGISAGTGDNINEGVKTAQENLTGANTAYGDSKKALSEGFNKYKGLDGNANAQFKDYIKTEEGSQLWDAAKNQRITVQNAAKDVGAAAGKDVNKIANVEGIQKVAQKQVGIGKAISNTWAKGGMGKAGLIAGGAGLLGMGALAAKGAFGGGQKEFSDDTDKELKEAAIIGSGLVLGGGAALAAKHGKLGLNKAQRETSKKAYDHVVSRIKGAWMDKKNVDNAVKDVIKESESAASTVKPHQWSEADFKKIQDAIHGKNPKYKGKTPSEVAKELGIKDSKEYTAWKNSNK